MPLPLLLCAVAGAAATPADAGAARVPSPFTRPLVLPVSAPAVDSILVPAPPATGALGIGADKYQHAALSAAFGLGAGVLSRSSVAALAVPLALGAAKELRDRVHTRFDAADLLADAVGAAVAAALTSALLRD